ncbi:MAG: DUF402 domain-containing protein [Nocardioides sp.]
MSPRPGDAVRVVMSKWGERPHWEYDAVLLGADEHGDWIGIPQGTNMSRPGAEYVSPVAQVSLVPHADAPPAERGWLATFHDEGGPVRVYVDMTTAPVWDGPVLRAVDLDLDVVCGPTGRVWVDDEDEFAEHRVSLGYPEEVVRLATSSCDLVRTAVLAGHPPYDGTARGWLDRLAAR